MGREKLFPPKQADDKRQPHERFADLARKVVGVPKSEVDVREQEWRKQHRPKER